MTLAKLQDLSGRVALVTGGSRGLGLQMAEVLGELGARVAISARKQAELEVAYAHLTSLGIVCLSVPCDMGDLDIIPALVERVVGPLGLRADRSSPPQLWCNARTPAVGFYQRMGWAVVSDVFEIPTAGPHVRMTKRLS